MPSLGERIVEHLTVNGASLDDGELAEALGVRPPDIAETCRQLEAQGLVVRNMAGGTRPVAVPRRRPTAVAPVPEAPAAAPPEPAPRRAPAPAPPPAPARARAAPAPAGPPSFPDHARQVLSARWGTTLNHRDAVLPGGVAQAFELVSGNGRIVGDVVSLAGRGYSDEAKASAIAEAVLVVGHVTNADRRFLVFGHDWDVLSRWLTRYRLLLDGVEIWFLDGDRLERLA